MKKLQVLLLSTFSLGAHAQSTPAWTWANSLGTATYTGFSSMTTDATGNTYVAGSFNQLLGLSLLHAWDVHVQVGRDAKATVFSLAKADQGFYCYAFELYFSLAGGNAQSAFKASSISSGK